MQTALISTYAMKHRAEMILVRFFDLFVLQLGADAGFLEIRGANLSQQSLGWRCIPSLRKHAETRGASPPGN